nr:cytochrome P450 [Tanacetum cinerariifolium]
MLLEDDDGSDEHSGSSSEEEADEGKDGEAEEEGEEETDEGKDGEGEEEADEGYLKEHKHPKHEAKLRSHITKLKWWTAKNHVDYKVFVMLHIESYNGDPIAKWDVSLCEESKEQVSLLRRVRIIYDLPSSRMEEVAGRGGRRKELAGRGGRRKKVTGHGAHPKKVAGRGGRQKKVTGKGGRHEEGVWSVEPDLFRSGGRRWKKVE